MKQQTAVEWLIEKFNSYDIATGKAEFRKKLHQAKEMEKNKIKEILILFCQTESYGACDVRTWVNNNGITFKPKDSIKQIKERVEYFINEILNENSNIMEQQITELPESIKEQAIKDLGNLSFGSTEEYKVHVLTTRERARLCLQIRPESKFAAHDDTNEILMDDWGIPKYILL